jgi:uncharacterized membrane protein YsdA (DUF1294 family)
MVSYELGWDERGRPRAMNVTYIIDRQPARQRQRQSQSPVFAVVVAVAFLAFVVIAVNVWSIHPVVIGVYVLASIATYLAYRNDKRAAQTGRWRTNEGTLLMLGLIGGWPGGLIAQHRFRHKTKKGSFQAAYWLTVVLNCVGLLLLHSK